MQCNIWGRSHIKGDVTAKVERLYRTVRAQAIGAGASEVLQELAVKQAKL